MAIHKLSSGDYVVDAEGTTKYVSYDPPRLETTYEGRVIRVFQQDYRAMSNVYTFATFAEVLHEENDVYSIREEILVNANFECDRNGGRAEVDATVGCIEIVKSLRAIEEGKKRQWEVAYVTQRKYGRHL